MDIHTRIRECRLALNMSQAEFARRLNMAYETARSWERPATHPKAYSPQRKVLPLVAEVLKVDVNYLLTGISDNVLGHRIVLIRRYVPERNDREGTLIDFTTIQTLGDPQDSFPYRSDWLRKMGLLAEYCRVAELDDPAMSVNGQVLLDTSQTTVMDGKLYLVLSAAGVRARYVHPCPDGSFILRADNQNKPELVAGQDIKIAGRIVACTNFI